MLEGWAQPFSPVRPALSATHRKLPSSSSSPASLAQSVPVFWDRSCSLRFRTSAPGPSEGRKPVVVVGDRGGKMGWDTVEAERETAAVRKRSEDSTGSPSHSLR